MREVEPHFLSSCLLRVFAPWRQPGGRRPAVCLLAGASVAIAACAPRSGGEPSVGAGRPSRAEVVDYAKRLVADLASDRFDAREGAARSLLRLGEGAAPALEDALRHPDPEVRAWGQHLVEQIALCAPEQREILARLRAVRVTLNFKDQPLSQVIDSLSRFAGLLFVFDGDADAENIKVTLAGRNQPLESALNSILRSRQLDYAIRDRRIHIVRAGGRHAFYVGDLQARAARSAPALAAMFGRMKGLKMDLAFESAGLQDIVDSIHASSGLDMDIDVVVRVDARLMSRRVSFKVHDLALDQTLSVLLAQFGLDYVFLDDGIYITHPPPPR